MATSHDREIVTALLSVVEKSTGTKILPLLGSKEEKTLASLPFPGFTAETPYAFALSYFSKCFLSKWKGLRTGLNTERAALESWASFEQQCKDTNVAIRAMRGSNDPALCSLISRVQRKISMVLGESPVVDTVLSGSRWSQGATFATRRGCSISVKMTQSIATTRRALPYIMRQVLSDRAWVESILGCEPSGPLSLLPEVFTIVKGNRSVVVPKNAKTGRTISAEPAGNAFLQQGAGRFIRRQLERFGVDLSSQEHNQMLAARANSTGLATLDLKGASDTISLELVYLLLPLNWAVFLDDLRSPETYIKGSWHRLSKFSSMGNAFTFELESLIFWAIISSVCGTTDRNLVSVYGDDLVVPADHSELVIQSLETFGFSLNRDKSFVSGPFYESCGKHYFGGEEVTAPYQQELVESPSELIRLTNRLVRWTYRMRNLTGADPLALIRLERALLREGEEIYMRKLNCQRKYVPRVPSDSVSDDGFLVHPSLLGKYSRQYGFRCCTLVYEVKTTSDYETPHYACKLRRPTISNMDPRGHVSISTGGRWVHREGWIHTWSEALAG